MAKFRERNMADYELVPGGLYDKYIGRKEGALTAIGTVKRKTKNTQGVHQWCLLTKCDCGNYRIITKWAFLKGSAEPMCYDCRNAESKKETKSLNTLWEEKRKERMKARGIKRMSQEALDAPCTIKAKDICIEGALRLLKALWKSLEKDYCRHPTKRAGIEEYIMSPDFGKLYFFIEPEYVINMLREKYNK